MKQELSQRIINRLTDYYTILREENKNNTLNITSSFISNMLKIDETQVRKDLKFVKCKGKCKVGYNVQELKAAIESFLGYNRLKKAVVIGAGNLGMALSGYLKFQEFGLEIVALFDSNKEKVGRCINDKIIYDISDLSDYITKMNISIAILTIPNKVAQDVCNDIVKCGIKYVWNFAPNILKVPANVKVWNENLISSFIQFCALENIE